MVCPGRILTNISINAVNGDGTNYGKLDEGKKNGVDAVTCAKKIVRAIDRKKREVLIGKMDLLMVYFKRYVPSLFFKIVVRLDPTK
jgi:short-subunit dehydrogenase